MERKTGRMLKYTEENKVECSYEETKELSFSKLANSAENFQYFSYCAQRSNLHFIINFVIRQNLQGRNTRVAVVLVQKNAPVPPGRDCTHCVIVIDVILDQPLVLITEIYLRR